LDLIPGIEMNTDAWGEEIHILGYYIEIYPTGFTGSPARIRQERHEQGK
jgi:predicted metal-dependent phosphoesterase TrpH